MGLDIRLPIGAMFVVLGLMLVVYGIVSDPAIYEASLGVNVNVWWGIVLTLFGAVFLLLGRRGVKDLHPTGMHPAETTPEGRATEAREHATGLESEERRS